MPSGIVFVYVLYVSVAYVFPIPEHPMASGRARPNLGESLYPQPSTGVHVGSGTLPRPFRSFSTGFPVSTFGTSGIQIGCLKEAGEFQENSKIIAGVAARSTSEMWIAATKGEM